MSYTPPDAHDVILNFEQTSTATDSHNLALNFNDSLDQLSFLNAEIDTRIQVQLRGSNTELEVNSGTLHSTINTSINADIAGTNQDNVDNHGTILATINPSIQSDILGLNDINHIVGVSLVSRLKYRKAFTRLDHVEIPWTDRKSVV